MSITQISTVVLEPTDKKQVKYLNKDFSDFKKSLVEFTKFYFADTYQDFSDASPGSIFIDMASYIGDVLSYYTDYSFKENLLAYAEEKENIVSLAQGFGYKPRLATPSFCAVSMSALIPADSDGNLDIKYLPRFLPGTSFTTTGQRDVGTFMTQDVCDFSEPLGREVTIFALDVNDVPTSFVVSKSTKSISATEKIIQVNVSDPTKFLKIQIPESNVVDIKSVVDQEGNTWYEVDNLSQDYIFQDIIHSPTNVSVIPFYRIKPIKVNRRFVVRLNRKLQTELVFGSGMGDLTDVHENPDYKSVYDQQYLQNMTNVALDTLNFTTSNSFGLSPGNTTLTITYRIAGGVKSNVGSGVLNKIATLNTGNETRTLSTGEQATFNAMLSSVSVVNDEAASGGGNIQTVEQMRQSAMGYINAQRRIVTALDYQKRVLSMPSKYGSIHKAFVVQDEAINSIIDHTGAARRAAFTIDPEDNLGPYVSDLPINTNINLYILGLDSNGRLTTINSTVKLNIKEFLKGYRMLTERINIVDAFRVSIGIDYNIIVYQGTHVADALVRCSDTIRKYFDIDRWEINQPIILDDLRVIIASVEGVQSVTNLNIYNKYFQKHGSDYAPYRYNLKHATENNVIYPSADPCIFELRHPQVDIVGSTQ